MAVPQEVPQGQVADSGSASGGTGGSAGQGGAGGSSGGITATPGQDGISVS